MCLPSAAKGSPKKWAHRPSHLWRRQRHFWTVILLSGSFLLGMTTASKLKTQTAKCGKGKMASNVINQPLEGRHYGEFCGIFMWFQDSITWAGRICRHLGTPRYTWALEFLQVCAIMCQYFRKAHSLPAVTTSLVFSSSHVWRVARVSWAYSLIGGDTVRNVFLPFHLKDTWEIFAW